MPRGSVKFESVAEARSHGVCSEMLRNTMEATKQEAGQLEFEQGDELELGSSSSKATSVSYLRGDLVDARLNPRVGDEVRNDSNCAVLVHPCRCVAAVPIC